MPLAGAALSHPRAQAVGPRQGGAGQAEGIQGKQTKTRSSEEGCNTRRSAESDCFSDKRAGEGSCLSQEGAVEDRRPGIEGVKWGGEGDWSCEMDPGGHGRVTEGSGQKLNSGSEVDS